MNKNTLLISTVLAVLLLSSRLIMHTPNFTPVLAILLLFSMAFDKKYLFIPFIAILVSDIALQYFSGGSYLFSPMFLSIYMIYIAIALAVYYLNKKITLFNVAINSLAAPVMFFLLSNFAVWILNGGHVYTYTFSGLLTCYTAAIPFFHNTLISTGYYSFILFAPFFALKSLQREYSFTQK
tara:strand:- start:192 stop:734 length:543 start_codon:yes stop_codon:yes gene_type:complete